MKSLRKLVTLLYLLIIPAVAAASPIAATNGTADQAVSADLTPDQVNGPCGSGPRSLTCTGFNGATNTSYSASDLPLLFEDDFNDGILDLSKWETRGKSVYEMNGYAALQENVTDTYTSLISKNFSPATKIRVEMRHFMHPNNDYYYPSVAFINNSDTPDDPTGPALTWMKSSYVPSYCSISGAYNKVMVKDYDKAGMHGTCYVSDLTSSNYYDQWITSYITYDATTGTLEYDLGGDGTIDFSAVSTDNIGKPISKLYINTYGWWTGMYHNVDWIRVYGASGAAVTATNGVCGTAINTPVSTAPTANLCASGTASAVTGTDPWAWTCSGSNGGSNVICTAGTAAAITQLTNNGADNYSPAWSPDGSTIVYASSKISSGDGNDIFAINADGSNERNLAQFTVTDPWHTRFGNPYWIGQTGDLLVMDYKIFFEGMRLNLSGAAAANALPVTRGVTDGDSPYFTKLLLIPGGQNGTIVPSPDGTKMAWRAYVGSTSHVIRMHTGPLNSFIGNSDSAGTLLYQANGSIESIAFSPDGSKIVFSACQNSCQGSGYDLYVLDIATKAAVQITNTAAQGVYNSQPAWSSSGVIAFVSRPDGSSKQDLYTIKPDGTGISQITKNTWDSIHPFWAPDSTALVYASNQSGKYELYKVSLAGGITINGACGSANGTAIASAPTTSLCSAGTASVVSGSGPWSWSCLGSNGGTSASCSADLLACSIPTDLFTEPNNMSGNILITWKPSSTAGVTYILTENDIPVYTGPYLYYNATGRANGSYSYAVKAIKSGSAESPYTTSVSTTVKLKCAKILSIIAPDNNKSGSYYVFWRQSTPGSVYTLYEDGVPIYTGTDRSYLVTGNLSGSYSYTVTASKSGYEDSDTAGPASVAVSKTSSKKKRKISRT